MITIGFDFKNRKASDLHQLNALLATMKLQELRLENPEGYLATARDGEGNLLHKRYGLDSGTLVCRLSKGRTGYQYQIDTVVVERSAGIGDEEFLDCWREGHPDRVIRIVITNGYADSLAYTIVHHQRI